MVFLGLLKSTIIVFCGIQVQIIVRTPPVQRLDHVSVACLEVKGLGPVTVNLPCLSDRQCLFILYCLHCHCLPASTKCSIILYR